MARFLKRPNNARRKSPCRSTLACLVPHQNSKQEQRAFNRHKAKLFTALVWIGSIGPYLETTVQRAYGDSTCRPACRKNWSPKCRQVIVLRAAASTAPLVMKGPTFCWALKESRKVVASQSVIFRSIQILNSLLGSLKSRAYFSHLGIKKEPQIKIWQVTRPVGAADLTVVYAARPHPVAR